MNRLSLRGAKHRVKKPLRVRNWAEYQAGRRNRGSLTVWVDVEAVCGTVPGWNAAPRARRKRGRQQKYSQLAIETARRLGIVFHLTSRQTEGLLRSLFSLLRLDADVPDHTTLSRRGRTLAEADLCRPHSRRPVHLIIDGTALRSFVGQVRGPPRDRDYRRLDLCVDELTGHVNACVLASKRARQAAARVLWLRRQPTKRLSSGGEDAALDATSVYREAQAHGGGAFSQRVDPPDQERRGLATLAGMAGAEPRSAREGEDGQSSAARAYRLLE